MTNTSDEKCFRCSYPLSQIASKRCPECGWRRNQCAHCGNELSSDQRCTSCFEDNRAWSRWTVRSRIAFPWKGKANAVWTRCALTGEKRKSWLLVVGALLALLAAVFIAEIRVERDWHIVAKDSAGKVKWSWRSDMLLGHWAGVSRDLLFSDCDLGFSWLYTLDGHSTRIPNGEAPATEGLHVTTYYKTTSFQWPSFERVFHRCRLMLWPSIVVLATTLFVTPSALTRYSACWTGINACQYPANAFTWTIPSGIIAQAILILLMATYDWLAALIGFLPIGVWAFGFEFVVPIFVVQMLIYRAAFWDFNRTILENPKNYRIQVICTLPFIVGLGVLVSLDAKGL